MNFFSCVRVCVAAVPFFLAPVGNAFASGSVTAENTVKSIDVPKSNLTSSESISPSNGHLTLSYTDLKIPGKAGMDLEIKRRYSLPSRSEPYGLNFGRDNRRLSLGWDIHFGMIIQTTWSTETSITNWTGMTKDATQPVISACKFKGAVNEKYVIVDNNPSLILPDGSQQVLVNAPEDGYSFKTKNGWRGGCASSGFTLYSPDGRKYDFNVLKYTAELDNGGKSWAWYVSKITDKYNNWIHVNYDNSTDRALITSVTTSDSRAVSFYYDTIDSVPTLTRIESNGQSIIYEYNADRLLSKVKIGDRVLWQYGYYKSEFPDLYLLDNVTSEAGGIIDYQYDFISNREIENFTWDYGITERIISGTLPYSKRTYNRSFDYSFGEAGYLQVNVIEGNKCVSILYNSYAKWENDYIEETHLALDDQIYSKAIYGNSNCNSNLLQVESFEWEEHTISSQTSNKFVSVYDEIWISENQYKTALLKKHTVVRDQISYETSFSDFTTFGSPKTTIEKSIDLTTNSTIAKRTTVKSIAEPPVDKGLEVLRSETVYDENNAIVSSASYTYDSNRSLIEKVDNGIKTTFTYYDDGNLKTATDAENKTSTYSNYYRGKAQRISDSVGALVKQFDYFGNLTLEKYDGYTPTKYEYEDFDRLIKIDRPTGYDVRYDYYSTYYTATFGDYYARYDVDGLNRVILKIETDTVSNNTRYTKVDYDQYGQTVFTSIPSTSSTETTGTTNEYDALGRIKHLITPTGDVTYEYQSGGKIKYTNARGYVYYYTTLGYGSPDYSNVVKMQNPSSSGTVYTNIEKDAVGRVLKVTQGSDNSNDHAITYTYDNTYKDLPSSVAQPDLTFHYTYYPDGARKSEKINNGATTYYYYDSRNRLKKTDYPSSVADVTMTYYPNNLLKTADNGIGDWSFSYDANGLETSKSLTTNSKTYTIDTAYNNHSHIDSMTYGGITVSYAPNAFGESTKAGNYASNVQHHAIGSLSSFTYGNGLTYSLPLHTNKVMIGSIIAKNGNTSVISKTYSYDEHANATAIVDNLNSNQTINNFSYDGLDRLQGASSAMWGGEVSFTYDRLGNILTKNRPDKIMTYTYDTDNRLESVATQGVGDGGFVLIGVGGVLAPIPFGAQDNEQGFMYDNAGNVILNSKHTLAYNEANQLTAAYTSGTSGQNYKYDALGKRVQSIDTQGKITYEIYDAKNRMLLREDSNGQRTRKVYLGNKLIASDKEGTREYIHFDTLGSTIGISDANRNLSTENYFPFGERVSHIEANNDQWYTGHKYDEYLDLSYMQARYYDPVIGRFYSNDPVDAVSHLGTLNGIHGFNRYAYANNNPYKYTDPTGKSSDIQIDKTNLGDLIAKMLGFGSAEEATDAANSVGDSVNEAVKDVASEIAERTSISVQNQKGFGPLGVATSVEVDGETITGDEPPNISGGLTGATYGKSSSITVNFLVVKPDASAKGPVTKTTILVGRGYGLGATIQTTPTFGLTIHGGIVAGASVNTTILNVSTR